MVWGVFPVLFCRVLPVLNCRVFPAIENDFIKRYRRASANSGTSQIVTFAKFFNPPIAGVTVGEKAPRRDL